SVFAVVFTAGTLVSLAGYAGEAEEAASPAPLTEAELIGILESDAEWLLKQEACRRLRHIGTEASVPALAALLPDETLSHMARFALEVMPYPEVDEALRDVLSLTEGLPQAGIIISIGVRQDEKAVPLLIPLMKDAHAEVARAAAGALGRIATPEAAQALREYRKEAADAIRTAVNEGLLAAAQHYTEAGKRPKAAAVYEELLAADAPLEVRMGAFRGLAYARPAQAPDRLVDALKGDEPMFRDLAAQIIGEPKRLGKTEVYAKVLPSLPPGGQAALLRGLADRGDAAARPVVMESVQSEDAEVRMAAIKALGVLGGRKEDVETLLALLPSEDEAVVEAVKEALVSMEGEPVDAALAANIAGTSPEIRGTLIRLLANRRADEAIPEALEGLKSDDLVVRAAGLDALALLGGPAETSALIDVIAKTTDESERATAAATLNAIAARKGDEILPIVLGAMNGAKDEVRLVLLQTAAGIGSAKALEAVLTAMNDPNADIAGEAVRMLSSWDSLDAVPHLETLAQSEDLTHYVLGLRGFVRLAREQAQGGQKMKMLSKALEFARRPDEVKLVLGAWGTVKNARAFEVLPPYLDNPEVRNEAALAIIGVAGQIDKKNENQKAAAVEALNAVRAKCEDAGIRDNAQKALDGLK
ncbi:MAG: HEAT repeat domain-containing protein, partial [Candidatus Hydrogenedentes bacterium]|nr:HEAT repeat domain-containing protein [Candidatus Hydrogenedentota bacterium]